MAKQTKKLSDLTTVTTTSGRKFPITDASGNVTLISLDSLKAELLNNITLESINDGVFIMFHQVSDGSPRMMKPHKWARYQDSGEIADGVVVVEGGKVLVVAPTESSSKLYWSSAAVTGGGYSTGDRINAYSDWTGKANTASQITHSECNTVSYAPGFCAAYSRANSNGKGLTAGKWWLPSGGELMMMYANMKKINYALSLISGATQLAEDAYWSSTEASSTHAWLLGFNIGGLPTYPKASYQCRVRAVSAFIS